MLELDRLLLGGEEDVADVLFGGGPRRDAGDGPVHQHPVFVQLAAKGVSGHGEIDSSGGELYGRLAR